LLGLTTYRKSLPALILRDYVIRQNHSIVKLWKTCRNHGQSSSSTTTHKDGDHS